MWTHSKVSDVLGIILWTLIPLTLGNEDDYIIISVVRSKELGFLKDLRRTNVMLTRCKKGMFICSSWKFLVEGKGAHSLVGIMAAKCGDDAWLSMDDIEAGNF